MATPLEPLTLAKPYKELSKRFIEKARAIGADDLLNRLARMALPQPKQQRQK
jgi:hypothetical protein